MDSPLETPDGDPVIWVNPDVPDITTVSTGRVDGFDCPYVDDRGQPCSNDFEISEPGNSPDENRAALVKLIERSNGTLRCEECNEPIYGFYGNGDH